MGLNISIFNSYLEFIDKCDVEGLKRFEPTDKNVFNEMLIYACTHYHGVNIIQELEIVDTLLNKGADVEFINSNGDNALQFALYHEYFDMILLLIQHGANKEQKYNNRGIMYILVYKYYITDELKIQFIKQFLARGVSPIIDEEKGCCFLHGLINVQEVFEELLKYCIKEDIPFDDNLFFKYIKQNKNHWDNEEIFNTVALMLKHGADPNKNDVLKYICQHSNNNCRLIYLLLNNDAKVDSTEVYYHQHVQLYLLHREIMELRDELRSKDHNYALED